MMPVIFSFPRCLLVRSKVIKTGTCSSTDAFIQHVQALSPVFLEDRMFTCSDRNSSHQLRFYIYFWRRRSWRGGSESAPPYKVGTERKSLHHSRFWVCFGVWAGQFEALLRMLVLYLKRQQTLAGCWPAATCCRRHLFVVVDETWRPLHTAFVIGWCFWLPDWPRPDRGSLFAAWSLPLVWKYFCPVSTLMFFPVNHWREKNECERY